MVANQFIIAKGSVFGTLWSGEKKVGKDRRKPDINAAVEPKEGLVPWVQQPIAENFDSSVLLSYQGAPAKDQVAAKLQDVWRETQD